jgi:hypothetical protein
MNTQTTAATWLARLAILSLVLAACGNSASSPSASQPGSGGAPAVNDASGQPPEAGSDTGTSTTGDDAGPPAGTGGGSGTGGSSASGDSGGSNGNTDSGVDAIVDRGPPTPGVLPKFPGSGAPYGSGHLRFNFPANGKTITVYAPQKPRDGLPWVWHGEFPDVVPNTNNAWLNKGLMSSM